MAGERARSRQGPAGRAGTPRVAPASVHRVLATPGQPLPEAVRGSLEPLLDHDFSRVRIHADPAAANAADAVGADAFTVGSHVVFAAERYTPGSMPGRRLLVHELTHVVQQAVGPRRPPARLPVAPGRGAAEGEAEGVADRLSPDVAGTAVAGRAGPPVGAVGGLLLQRTNAAETAAVFALGTTAGTGLQLVPAGIAGTRIGPVSGRGGLIHDEGAQRVSVVVGAGVTLRQLATSLLPLWETAAPFIPEGSTTPAPRVPLDADTLARALLVYDRALLLPPGLTGWRSGLRLPLPIRIDRQTDEGVLHPLVVVGLAGEFDPAWEPLLDQPAAALGPAAATDLAAAVESFVSERPSALDRGVFLAARALTNAAAERELVVGVLDRLGTDAFATALALMDTVVNHQVELLASQAPGAAILDRIRAALATPPADLSEDDGRSLERARRMLARVAGVAARETPTLAPAEPAAGADAAVEAGQLVLSAEGADFIAGFEGFRGELYDDAAGHCTIGIGHLVHRGNCNGTEPQEFRDGIDRARALELLQEDAADAAAAVRQEVTVELTQAQFDALVSFTFNLGAGALRGSTLLRELNAGNYDEVPNQLNRWTQAGGVVLRGLVRRRAAEGNLFQNGTYE